MKRKIVIAGMLGFTALFGCSQDSEKVEAGLPEGFDLISKDEIDKGNIYVLRNKSTGCYYTYTTSVYSDTFAPNVEIMFIEKNGVTVPYCE